MSRRAPVLASAAALALLAGGCGVSLKGVDEGHAVTATATVAADTLGRTARGPTPALPARPAGVVDVDGQTSGSLTHAVVATLGASPTVEVRDQGAGAAFGELCSGTIDAVDSTSPITADEWDACAAHGVEPVELAVAADGVVAVTRGGGDVGVDCLTVGQLQGAYRAGSPIENWRQLGGYDLPLHATGPATGTDAFDLFGRNVLGVDPPSLTLMRSDYRPQADDDAIRARIVGSPALQQEAAQEPQAVHDLAALRAAIARKGTYLRQLRVRVAHDTAAAQLAQDETALSITELQAEKLARGLQPAVRFAATSRQAVAALRTSAGELGFVGFDYAEFYEDQLRPIEIDASMSATTPAVHNCIYPSQETITSGTYPLASRFLITVSLSGLHRAAVRRFLGAYLAHAQVLAADAGLVPMTDAEITIERGWLAHPNTAPVIVYPSPAQRAAARRRAQAQAAAAQRRAIAAAQQRAEATAAARQAAQAEAAASSAQPTVTPDASGAGVASSASAASPASAAASAPQTSAPTSAPQAASGSGP